MNLFDRKKDYALKLLAFSDEKLFKSLDENIQNYIAHFGAKNILTYQELRQVSEIAIDLKMWGHNSIINILDRLESKYTLGKKNSKKYILKELQDYWNNLKINPTDYDKKPAKVKSVDRKVEYNKQKNEVLGKCPVASEKTVCCNLITIDAIQGCSLGCSYCSIQTFYQNGKIAVDSNLEEKLRKIELDPQKNYHIGSGQSSDSLALGNSGGVLDAQLKFARRNSNIILEFKTKSKKIDYLLSQKLPSNIFITWSLNPQVIIDNEEHFTASLNQRLEAARKIADKGTIVGFHFHPIVYYDGWEDGYQMLVKQVMDNFSIEEIGMISMGTLTFIKPAINNLRKLGIPSKVLQMPMSDASGKVSYPFETKKKIFSQVYNAFSLWHNDVFFYFCMEEQKLWQSVMGRCYQSNEEFEKSLFRSVFDKMN